MNGTRLTLQEVAGPLTDFLMKLLGGEANAWLREFKKFLRKEKTWVLASDFPTWKTIKLGTGLKIGDDFCKAFEAVGCILGSLAVDLLCTSAFKFAVADKKIEVELVRATVKELTGKNKTFFWDVLQCAKKRGWKRCSPEVGPQLRLQYLDQPYGEKLKIVMGSIYHNSFGRYSYFSFSVVRDDGGQWLHGESSNYDSSICSGDDQFVFQK